LNDVGLLVRENRLVTLVGAGGCGKTRLAIEVAARVAATDGGAVAWIDLASTTTERDVDDAVVASLGLQTAAGASRVRILEHLERRSCVLVVDNCEHLIDAAALLVAEIHQRCGHVHVLATSREPLSLTDEIVWRVPSLSVPNEPTLAGVLESEAGLLLVDRIGRARGGYEATVEDLPALVRISHSSMRASSDSDRDILFMIRPCCSTGAIPVRPQRCGSGRVGRVRVFRSHRGDGARR